MFPELEGASGTGGGHDEDKIFPPERVLMGRNLHTEARFLSSRARAGGDLSGDWAVGFVRRVVGGERREREERRGRGEGEEEGRKEEGEEEEGRMLGRREKGERARGRWAVVRRRALRPPDTRGGGGSAAHPPSGPGSVRLSRYRPFVCCPSSPVSPAVRGLIFFLRQAEKCPGITSRRILPPFSFPTEPHPDSAAAIPPQPALCQGGSTPPRRCSPNKINRVLEVLALKGREEERLMAGAGGSGPASTNVSAIIWGL